MLNSMMKLLSLFVNKLSSSLTLSRNSCIDAAKDDRQNAFAAILAHSISQLHSRIITFRLRQRWYATRHLWHWHIGADASGEQNYEENNPARCEADLSEAHPAWVDDEWQKFFVSQTRCYVVAVGRETKLWHEIKWDEKQIFHESDSRMVHDIQKKNSQRRMFIDKQIPRIEMRLHCTFTAENEIPLLWNTILHELIRDIA